MPADVRFLDQESKAMMRAVRMSITDVAAAALRRDRADIKVGPGEVFALVYLSSVTDADGTPEPGFRPGYMAAAWPDPNPMSGWTLAQLPDGTDFRFTPRFEWQADRTYVVDLTGNLYSIGPESAA